MPTDLNFQYLEMCILKGLNPSTAAGIDNLLGKLFKNSALVLVQPIT